MGEGPDARATGVAISLIANHHLVQEKVVTRTTAGPTFLGEGLAMVLGPDLLNSLVNAVSHNSNERYRFLN